MVKFETFVTDFDFRVSRQRDAEAVFEEEYSLCPLIWRLSSQWSRVLPRIERSTSKLYAIEIKAKLQRPSKIFLNLYCDKSKQKRTNGYLFKICQKNTNPR